MKTKATFGDRYSSASKSMNKRLKNKLNRYDNFNKYYAREDNH